MQIHGGEGKTKDIKLDFSVNINPLGMPKAVRDALRSLSMDPSALEIYPDRTCGELRRAAADHYRVPENWIVCGCGASELIYKIAGQYRGCRALVVSPGFGEYEKALREAGCQVSAVELKRERNFAFDEDFLRRFCQAAERMKQPQHHRENLPEFSEASNAVKFPESSKSRKKTGRSAFRQEALVFLCSPNNPVGGRIPEEMLREILNFCMQRGIRAVVDECFLPFVTGEEPTVEFLRESSMGENGSRKRETIRDTKNDSEKTDHEKVNERTEDMEARDVCAWPIILKALTKSHGIPGVRLGLAISPDTELIRELQNNGAPWTVSGIAAALGKAAFEGWDEEEFASLRKMVAEERAFLEEGLAEAGAKVYPGEGNFILFSADGGESLFEFMRSRGILIRSCESFGLGADFYRIAVRKREENERFLEVFMMWTGKSLPTP